MAANKTDNVVVITGSTRGIGYGLASAFLDFGCRVVINGRTQEAVDRAISQLAASHPSDHITGVQCDVSDARQVQNLWDRAIERFGRVDIWINNAGLVNALQSFWEIEPVEMSSVVRTNVLGTMFGSRTAIRGMLAQGYGAVYNMEGMGSSGRGGGRKVDGLSIYGSSKSALRYFTDALAGELKGSPVLVGGLQPGMVVTAMLTEQFQHRPEEWERSKRIFNILADRVETVTPWLAEQILANKKHGVHISWYGRFKVLARFLKAPFVRRNVIT